MSDGKVTIRVALPPSAWVSLPIGDRGYDPNLDSYLSWRAFIEILRQRWLAGEEITGPWAKREEKRDDRA